MSVQRYAHLSPSHRQRAIDPLITYFSGRITTRWSETSTGECLTALIAFVIERIAHLAQLRDSMRLLVAATTRLCSSARLFRRETVLLCCSTSAL